VKTIHRATLASILAAVALLASSCNNAYGVFSSIQKETKQEGSDCFKKAAVMDAYRIGSNYYARGLKLWTRAVGSTSWSLVPIGGTTKYQRLLASACDGTNLYVSILDSGGSNKVYVLSSGTWSEITAASASGAWIDALYCANGLVFAQLHANVANDDDETDDTYTLYYSTGGTAALTTATGLSTMGSADSFVGVAYGDSNYWCATRSALFQGATPAAISAYSATGGPGSTITSIAYFDYLYVSTYDYSEADYPYLYCLNGTWSHKEIGSGGPLAALGYVSTTKVLVGEGYDDNNTDTDGGYYEGTFSSFVTGEQDDTSYVTCSESIYSTTVGDKAVNAFFWDSANSTLFICLSPGTASSTYFGLYSTTLSGSAWSGWKAE